MSVRRFTSAAERQASDNLRDFIDAARASNPFGVPDWDAVQWILPKRTRASRSGVPSVLFTCHAASRKDRKRMEEPFGSFVRAVICTMEQNAQGLSESQFDTMVRACRYLHDAIVPRGADPTKITAGDLDAAEQSAKVRESPGAAYNVGLKLARLAAIVNRRGLTPIPLEWNSRLPRPERHFGVGERFEQRRQARLPPPAVLDALADIANRAELTDRDLLRQRASELLMCCGFRLNELLTLPRAVWVEVQVRDENGDPALNSLGQAATRCGLRYWPEKGGAAGTQVKWLPSAMVDIARRAIRDILRITAPAAEIARYQHENPGRTTLGSPWDEMPADQVLSARDVGLALHLSSKRLECGGRQYIRQHRLPETVTTVSAGRGGITTTGLGVRKGDLEADLVERSRSGRILPRGEADVKLHECLFVVPLNFCHGRNESLAGAVQLLRDRALTDYIAGRDSRSIFARLGFTELRIRSHQFRHWLNTLAQEGGLSQLEIARWMGRRNIGQNADYDHTKPLQRARRVQERLTAGKAHGPVAEQVSRMRDPIRRAEFVQSLANTAHATDLGICLHDWTTIPCERHGACAGCDEHWVVKGDPVQRANAQKLRDDTESLLRLAEVEAADETYGADNWLTHHRVTLRRLDAILAIHDNPEIPDGWLVQLSRDGIFALGDGEGEVTYAG